VGPRSGLDAKKKSRHCFCQESKPDQVNHIVKLCSPVKYSVCYKKLIAMMDVVSAACFNPGQNLMDYKYAGDLCSTVISQ
jgi:hypothetical protein